MEPRETVAVIDMICGAIGERRMLGFVYKSKSRISEPYILGTDAQGELVLSAYQTEGGSGLGFRSFSVAGLSEVTVTDDRFRHNRREYNPRDRFFARVICQV